MKTVFLLVAVLAVVYYLRTGPETTRETAKAAPKPDTIASVGYLTVYDQLNLGKAGLKKSVFEYALRGWQQIDSTKTMLTIADLSQPSTKKRLYVIDLAKKKLLFNTYVAHGNGSGDVMPNRFSNKIASHQTSLGFYKTHKTYMGKHGLSLQLKGLEKGINDNVFDRNIVLHGARYVCEDTIRQWGRLGRSEGCPAVPYADSKGIIQAVKGGTCLFVYAPDLTYLRKSAYLSKPYTGL